MKKFLSLALATLMLMSLFTMNVSAASAAKEFTDDDSITYQEAVDVISAIEVMDGYEDGSFKPTGALTRGAAAKIITNLILGPATASTLTASKAPFPDVPVNHTFAAEIAYCAQNKIINGYNDGNFNPGGPLTGFAFLKMLEGALGYDGSIEGFTGGNWSINVAKIANGIGLTDDLAEGFSGSATVDRQTAALFAFNTLKADLVEYAPGTTVAKSVTANTQATTDNNWKNIVNETRNDRGANRIVQFGERYFPRLVRNEGYYTYNGRYGTGSETIASQTKDIWQDSLGRPATHWDYKGESIGTYTEEADLTYVGSKKINQIYADLGMNTAGDGYLYINGLPFNQKIITDNGGTTVTGTSGLGGQDPARIVPVDADGVPVFTSANYASVSRGNTDALSDLSKAYSSVRSGSKYDAKIGDGTLIEVYRNEMTNEVLICAISLYGGKVTTQKAADSVKDDYVIIEGGSRDPYTANNTARTYPMTEAFNRAGRLTGAFTTNGHNEYETTAFEAGTVVGYTYSDKNEEIADMFTLESVQGKLARKTVGNDLTLGDTTYAYSKEYTFEDGLGSEDNLLNSSEYIVYLDTDGHALWIEEAEFNAENYALIERITNEFGGVVYSDYLGNDQNWSEYGLAVKTEDAVKNTYKGLVTANTTNGVLDIEGLEDDVKAQAGNLLELVDSRSGSTNASLWDLNTARLLLADGTYRTVSLDKAYVTEMAKATNEFTALAAGSSAYHLTFTAGTVIRYSVNNNGDYRIQDTSSLNHTESIIAPNFQLVGHVIQGVSSNYKDSNGTPWTIVGDNSTIIVARANESESYRVYTGIRNAPTINKNNPGIAYIYAKDGVAKIVFIVSGQLTNDGRNITFIAQRSMSDSVLQNDGKNYYRYNAVVGGKITTIFVAADAKDYTIGAGTWPDYTGGHKSSTFDLTPGKKPDMDKPNVGAIFNSTSWDDDGIYTKLQRNDWTEGVSLVAEEGITRSNSEEVQIGTKNSNRGTILTFASGAKAYSVTSGGGITEIETSEVITDKNTMVYAMTDDGEITAIFICKQYKDR